MNALQPGRASFHDDRRNSLNLKNFSSTARDVELGGSPYLSAPKIRRFPSPALSELSLNERRIDTEVNDLNLELSPEGHEHYSNVKERLRSFWQRNWGLAFVFFAQFFGNLMAVTARLLEQDTPTRKGMHTFQILFDRMIVSAVVSTIYMWYFQTPDVPLGPKPVRLLLAFRGFAGFFGVSGMFLSLQYLSLSDATVISFLAPPLACLACSYILKEPFTRTEQIATAISLLSVVLIAQPTAVFNSINLDTPVESATSGVTPRQRLLGVAFCMIGVLGGGTQLVCLRCVGNRVHPMISVNYLNVIVAVITAILLTFLPGLTFAFPPTLQDWFYLSVLSASGIILQCLLAAGLGAEKSSRATNMTYSQMLFAVLFDFLIWGTLPGPLSMLGSTLILGSAIYVAVQKDVGQSDKQESHGGDYIALTRTDDRDSSEDQDIRGR